MPTTRLPNIYLTGYMFSGKTTVGRQLAEALGRQFIDTDILFEERYHTNISIFFNRYGEAAFRQLERETLHLTAELDDVVVATGGGTPCFGDNMQWINRHGLSVYLKMTTEEIYTRLLHSKKRRPAFAGMTQQQCLDHITKQLEERMPYYRQAHITVESYGNPVESILKAASAKELAHD